MACKYSRKRIWGFAVGISLAVIGIFGLIGVGVAVTLPYEETKRFGSQTDCAAIEVIYRGLVQCTCPSARKQSTCHSLHPCVLIRVNYVDENGDIETNATLYETALRYSTLQEIQCSVIRCSRYPDDNEESVDEFVQQYGGLNGTYPCYYSPDDPGYVFLEIVPLWGVLLGMILSATLFVVGVGLICVFVFFVV